MRKWQELMIYMIETDPIEELDITNVQNTKPPPYKTVENKKRKDNYHENLQRAYNLNYITAIFFKCG